MQSTLEVLFSPVEFAALARRDLSATACVVFDILRATSTIVTALANGAKEIIPVAEIPDALAIHKQDPAVLLAGERDGLRIRASMAGGTVFHLGNSPREFTTARVRGKTIALTTSNGSRALRACIEAHAHTILIGSFLNLRATADYLELQKTSHLLLICSGTLDQAAYEDIAGAGAMVDLLWPRFAKGEISDSARVARQIYLENSSNLLAAVEHSRNGRRLQSIPDLRDDVPFCLRRDVYSLVAKLQGDAIRKVG